MAMIDIRALTDELQQARLARLEAEDAGDDLEEMVWAMQCCPRILRRLTAAGPRDEEPALTH
jgi:hypothetical protein